MKSSKRKKTISPSLQNKLSALEQNASDQGIQLHYDLLEAAGLKLKGGLCKIKGEYHLFIDRRKSVTDKIEILQDYVDKPLPKDVPENEAVDGAEGKSTDNFSTDPGSSPPEP
ncbi:hypothetical protein PITCH_A330014 [uncultured Desulfobacterium sp.]|uniref:Uncharacterized protein n=1 Tax=uncultured Desulfobacterium sp. TaxID=201089 RepID=A0A445MZ86_9BACT|nr:hypothetical protein PITCH_A330014 [uncultured Desulfobacterium sp.]